MNFIVKKSLTVSLHLVIFPRLRLSLALSHFLLALVLPRTPYIINVNLNWLSKFDKSGTPWLSGFLHSV